MAPPPLRRRPATIRHARPAHITGGLDRLVDECASLQHERSRLLREIEVWDAKLAERRRRLGDVEARLDLARGEYDRLDREHRAKRALPAAAPARRPVGLSAAGTAPRAATVIEY